MGKAMPFASVFFPAHAADSLLSVTGRGWVATLRTVTGPGVGLGWRTGRGICRITRKIPSVVDPRVPSPTVAGTISQGPAAIPRTALVSSASRKPPIAPSNTPVPLITPMKAATRSARLDRSSKRAIIFRLIREASVCDISGSGSLRPVSLCKRSSGCLVEASWLLRRTARYMQP
jgi:hypothetical protein